MSAFASGASTYVDYRRRVTQIGHGHYDEFGFGIFHPGFYGIQCSSAIFVFQQDDLKGQVFRSLAGRWQSIVIIPVIYQDDHQRMVNLLDNPFKSGGNIAPRY